MSQGGPGHSYRSAMLILTLIVLMGAAGAAGFFIAKSLYEGPVQQATLRISVQNRFSSPATLSFQILVNGKVKQTLAIPANQAMSVDQPETFTAPDGAYFAVQALATNGASDSASVLVNTPGIYVVSLSP